MSATQIFGQESHFSQVTKIPLVNNPANAGVMDYDLRVTNNYRTQWKKINIPYKTLHFGIDKKIYAFNQAFGVGIDVLSDFSQSNIIASNKFSITLSHSQYYKNHQFVVGGSIGQVVKNYNPNNFTFGEQWDVDGQFFNPNLTNGENTLETNLNFTDISAGVMWRSKLKNFRPFAGFSVDHVNQPSLSFLDDGNDEKLALRFNVHGDILIPLTEKYDITPTIYYGYLKGAHNFVGGNIWGMNTSEMEILIERVYGISFFRINPARNIDAVILGGGIEFYSFDLGISYDFNISALRKATHFQGAFEISLIFKHGRNNTTGSAKPCYML